jgi:hypothetical protein
MWCYVEVAPGHRRRGHGTALLQALRDRTDRPLRGKVTAGSAGAHFAGARGFRTIQRCRTLALETRPDAPGLVPVDDDPVPARAAEAFRAFYATTHEWDPLGDVAPDEFVASHIDDAVACFVVGEGLAVGCLYDEGAALLLSGGPTRTGEPAATEALVAAAAACAARAGRPLTAEVDDANESLARAVQDYEPVLLDETHVVADG